MTNAPALVPAKLCKTQNVSGDVGVPGDTLYLPFDLPEGIERLQASFDTGTPDTKLGLGVFDARGTAFQASGFRGISGEERRSFFIASNDATPGFIAGPLKAGRWTVVVPNFLNFTGTANVKLEFFCGDPNATPALTAVSEAPVVNAPGWYKGDLHVHTVQSSGAFGSGKALSPAAMARRAQGLGLDFIALTDHNVARQNDHLLEDAPARFLLIGGEEVTTWVGGPGHLIVAGLAAGEHVDWRFRPRYGRYARTPTWKADDRPIQDVLAYVRGRGLYASAAHPYVAPGLGSDWGFFQDSDLDANALPGAFEIWNDSYTQTSGDLTLRQWDAEMAKGRKVCGNGGSDVHGVGGTTEVGHPTTVVYATSLSRAAVIDAMRNCRMYVTRDAKGPSLILTATRADGTVAMMGDTISGSAVTTAVVHAAVRGGSGAILTLVRDGAVVSATPIGSDTQTVDVTTAVGSGGAIRAELRPTPGGASTEPLALSNPLFFALAN